MIQANHSGIAEGQFTLPSNIPAGTKFVEFIGDRGTRAVTQFTGSGTITIEERRRIRVVERFDPLAQTFTLLNEGRHISAVGIFFEDIGTQPINVQIRETANGVPTGVVLCDKRIEVADIQAVGTETKVAFDTPVFFDALTEYAVVILTDDGTHSLAIAEVGQYDRRTQAYVTKQGYTVGVLLSSSNASTWTPHNNGDLAFKLYAAKFTTNTHTHPLLDVTANNASDFIVMADIERTGIETDAVFSITDTNNTAVRLQENQPASLSNRISDTLSTQVTLLGSEKRSPILYAGASIAVGDIAQTADYVTRAVVAGSGIAIATLEVNTPAGSHIDVELEIDGVWQAVSPQNGEPLGDGWVRNEYKHNITGGNHVRCRVTLNGTTSARPKARQLRLVTT